MGVTVAVARVAANTSTGTQDITTADLSGLTPVAVLLVCSEGVTDGTAANQAQLSIGACSGAGELWCFVQNSEHGQTTTDTHHSADNDELVRINTPGTGTVVSEANFDSFITNGVRINWTTNGGTAYLITAVFFAGTDLSAHAGVENMGNAVDNSVDITAPGFEPDVILSCFARSAINSDNTETRSGLGAVHNDGVGGITQRSIGWQDRNGQTTTFLGSWFSNVYGCVQLETNGNLRTGFEFGTFDASGFTVITRSNGASNGDLMYLALNFGGVVDSYVGTYSTPTSTGNNSSTAPGFTPQAIIFGMTQIATANSQITDETAGPYGIAAFDADDEFSTSIASEDGVTTSNTQSLSDNTAVELPDDDGAAGLTASFVSFDANGWTLNYSAVQANAKYFWALAIEEEAVAGRTTRNTDPYGLGIGSGISRTVKVGGM